MRLARLQGLEREKIDSEYNELMALIAHLTEILGSERMVLDIIKKEITEIKDKFGDDRRTSIEPVADDIDIEDLIEEEDNVITMTHSGYIKRLSVDTYKNQHRGGKGIIGMQTKEEDSVESMFISSTHAHIMFFTNKGRMYRLKAYEIPETGRQAKGTAIVNLLQLEAGEKISATIPLKEYEDGKFLIMATKKGIIKKTPLSEYENAPRGGKIAINLDEGDELIKTELTDGNSEIFLGTQKGKMIRFAESDVRPLGRVSRGVRGIILDEDDEVVGMGLYRSDAKILVVSENGYGKRTNLSEYRLQTRGGKGTATYKISEATGNVAGFDVVTSDEDIILITSEGVVIRLACSEISTLSRITKGVRLMRLADGVRIVSMARIMHEDEENSEDDIPAQAESEKNVNETSE